MLTVNVCSETALFREWSDQIFHGLEFRKHISYDEYHFIQNV